MTNLMLILALGAPAPLERKLDKHPVELCGTWSVSWLGIVRDWHLDPNGTWHSCWCDDVYYYGTWERTNDGIKFVEYYNVERQPPKIRKYTLKLVDGKYRTREVYQIDFLYKK